MSVPSKDPTGQPPLTEKEAEILRELAATLPWPLNDETIWPGVLVSLRVPVAPTTTYAPKTPNPYVANVEGEVTYHKQSVTLAQLAAAVRAKTVL